MVPTVPPALSCCTPILALIIRSSAQTLPFQGTFSGHPTNTDSPSTPSRSLVTAISCWQGIPAITASTAASAESRSSVTTCGTNSLNTQEVSLLHCISCHFKKIQHNFYFLKNHKAIPTNIAFPLFLLSSHALFNSNSNCTAF